MLQGQIFVEYLDINVLKPTYYMLSADKFHALVYPIDLPGGDLDDNVRHALFTHIENIDRVVEQIEAEYFPKSRTDTPAKELASLLLLSAGRLMGNNVVENPFASDTDIPDVLMMLALELTGIAIHKGGATVNPRHIARILSSFDDQIEADKLGFRQALAKASPAKGFLPSDAEMLEKHANESDSIYKNWLIYIQNMTIVLVRGAMRIPFGTEAAAGFHEMAFRYVDQLIQESLFHCYSVFASTAHLCHLPKDYPSALPVVEELCDRQVLFAGMRFHKERAAGNLDRAAKVVEEAIYLQASVLIEYNDQPSVRDRAINAIFHHWTALKEICPEKLAEVVQNIEDVLAQPAIDISVQNGFILLRGVIGELGGARSLEPWKERISAIRPVSVAPGAHRYLM